MPQLDPTWFASQLFWLVVTFVALYFILSRFVLPPLQEVIARRASTLEGDLAQAQSLKSDAEAARAEYERTLAEARGKAQELVSEAVASFKAKAEAANKDMDRKVEAQLAEASRRITAKKEEMMASLAPTMGELTSLIFEKLTQQSPTGEKVLRAVGGAKGRR